jgi:glycosyltransferase 2 family protein
MIARLKRQSPLRLLIALGMILFSIALLIVLIYRQYDVLRDYRWNLHWVFILGGFGALLPGLLLAAAVWADLMRSLGSRVRFVDHIRYYCITHLGRRLPGTLWYVAGRSYFYKQHNESLKLVATASGLELIISVVSGALVTILFSAYAFRALPSLYLIGLLGVLALGVALTHPQVIHQILRRMKLPIPHPLRYVEIVRWLIGYGLIWIAGGIVLFMIVNAVTALALFHLPFIITIWSLVGTLSITVFFLPSNLGFTEVSLSLLLSTLVPSSLAVVIALLVRLALLAYEIVGAGGVVLITNFMKNTQSDE